MGFVILLFSCRNEDFSKQNFNNQRTASEFFKHSLNSNALSKSGVDYVSILEAYNEETGFITRMPDQKGLPIWDKMLVFSNNSNTALLIPLSEDSETLSSILFATLDAENSVKSVRDIDNAYVQNYIYNTENTVKNREELFFTFMMLDNHTFGNRIFSNLPEDLFSEYTFGEYNRILTKDFDINGTLVNLPEGKLMFESECVGFWHCKGCADSTILGCDFCWICYSTKCRDVPILTNDDPAFPVGGNSTGGGGGGSGTTTPCTNCPPPPPKDPCSLDIQGKAFYRLKPSCGTIGNGEEPIGLDPCQKTKAMLQDPEIQPKIQDLKDHADSGAGTEKGWNFNKSGPPTEAQANDDNSVIMALPSLLNKFYHNHTGTEVDIFSASDIWGLIQIARYQNIGSAGNAASGLIAPNGIHYVIYFNGTHAELPPIDSYDETKIKTWNMNQKILLFALRKKPGFFNIVNGNKVLNDKGLEQIFFTTIAEMGLTDKIVLQKVENNNISTISQNSDGSTFPTPCNEN